MSDQLWTTDTAGGFAAKLGIEILEATPDGVVATMPVGGNEQPDGILHGGATMSLIETVASVAAAVRAGWPENLVVGQSQICNYVRPATSGSVKAVASVVHVGRTTHVWDVDVTSVETGKRIAVGRVTMAVRPRPEAQPKSG